MPERHIDHIETKEGTLFTLYFKEEDIAIQLSRQTLIELIKEASELLELTGEKDTLFKDERGI